MSNVNYFLSSNFCMRFQPKSLFKIRWCITFMQNKVESQLIMHPNRMIREQVSQKLHLCSFTFYNNLNFACVAVSAAINSLTRD